MADLDLPVLSALQSRPYVSFDAVSKLFPGVKAVDGISFNLREGRVHGLVGENGAGKSTLLKMLSGAYTPTSGHVVIGGQARIFRNPSEARAAGIAVIYQELNLIPEMTVEENLLLGQLPAQMGFVKRKAMRAKAVAQLQMLGEDIDPSTKVKRLSIGQRQMLEIAKALLQDAKVIAFDEPTSSLSEREASRLFGVIGDLRKDNRVIIYVSHRLEEVFGICDEITVLRDGRVAAYYHDVSMASHDDLVRSMVGRSITDIYHYTQRTLGAAVLEAEDIRGPGLSQPARFSVAAGEIVGFFGLVGAGRTELMKLIFGAVKRTAGIVKLEGRQIPCRSPRQSIRCGMAFCPEDRKREGLSPVRSVAENINISIRRILAWFGFFINGTLERKNAETFVTRLAIKTPSLNRPVMHLSGGNQQKVILARWLSEKIKVLIVDEPTRGIDVGAKSEIYGIIDELAHTGMGIAVVSSDLPEVLGIADRIIVMREGAIVASLDRSECTQEKILHLALPIGENKPVLVHAGG